MRRTYAFEAEGVSEEVKSQLEKVEDVVEDKCATPEACDKMIDKIDAEKDKFNGALKDMAAAAKDCKDGNCTKSEMAAAITPKMAELKEVAKSIGVASEGEALTEGELKDAKAYLDGAKEIVEAKKDELENGKSDEKADEPKDDDDKDEAECEDGECDDDDDEEDEEATESYLDDLDIATESAMLDLAMEGTNIDALKARKAHLADIRAAKKAMKAAAKAKDYKTAAAEARKAAEAANALASDISGLDQSAGSAAIVGIALAVAALAAGVAIGGGVGAIKGNMNAAKVAKDLGKLGLNEMGQSTMAKGAFKTTLKGGIKAGAAAGGAAAGAVGAGHGAAAIAKVLKSKGVEDTGDASKLQPNDLNALLSAIKIDAKNMAKKFTKKAEEYDKMASSATESMLADDSIAMEMFGKNKERTIGMDDAAVIKAYVEANASSMKSGEDVDAAMKTAIAQYNEQMQGEGYSLSKKTIAGVPILITSNNGKPIEIQYSTGGKRFKSVSMTRARSAVGKGLRKADKAGSATESDTMFDDFITACESIMDDTDGSPANDSNTPYLFG